MNVIDLFAGVGGWSEGARQVGHNAVAAIESDQVAARYYAKNHGDHVHEVDILNVEPQALPDCGVLLASPPCPNFSVAKARGSETELDIALARKVAGFIATKRPRYVFLENVSQYRKSQSWEIIQDNLNLAGYWTQTHHLNSADFGVPQTRKRMIVRAVRDGYLPPLPPKQKWVGWYAAVEDILDTLPESEFAPWQEARLPERWEEVICFLLGQGQRSEPVPAGRPAHTITSNHNQLSIKAFLLGGGNTNLADAKPFKGMLHPDQPSHTVKPHHRGGTPDRAFLISAHSKNGGQGIVIRTGNEPSVTVTASANKAQMRAWLSRGRVVQMNVHALARFQSFPDGYIFPEGRSAATRLIGNAVPPEMAAALLEGLR